MDNEIIKQGIVSSFPPPPPYYLLFDKDDIETKIKPPPCIEGCFTCFGSQLSSEISIRPLDSDTIMYNESTKDLPNELKKLNEMFQIEILKLLENSGKGIVDSTVVKKIVKIYVNMNHILEKFRIIQAYHQIRDELEVQVNEKRQLIDEMKKLIDQYQLLKDSKKEVNFQ